MNVLANPLSKFMLYLLTLFSRMSYIKPLYSHIAVFFSALVLIIALSFQIAVFVTHEIGMHIIVETVPSIAALSICLIQVLIAHLSRKKYEEIFARLVEDTEKEMSEEEEKLGSKYEKCCRLLLKLITSLVLGSFAIPASGFFPKLLDIIMPLNESRPHALPFRGEHFVDEEEYFYILLGFQYLTILVAVSIAGSIETMFLIVVYHACGMFAIIGYRMENIVQRANNYRKYEQTNDEKRIIHAFANCTQMHRRLVYFIYLIESCGNEILIMVLFVTVISFSFCLVQVTNVELVDVKSVLFSGVLIGQFFLLNLMGQLIINESMKLPNKVYNAEWYSCSPRLQKLFVILILRTQKYSAIVASDIFVLSLQNFSSVAQAAMSYCMVLRQFQ